VPLVRRGTAQSPTPDKRGLRPFTDVLDGLPPDPLTIIIHHDKGGPMNATSLTHDDVTRNEVIARNLAVVADHFANENPDGIEHVIAGYADDIVWEAPARSVVFRDKDQVRAAYLRVFESMDVHRLTPICRFATEDWVFDDSIVEFTLIGDGFTNCPFELGTRVNMRLVHAFQLRDGKICRENGYEIWRRA
jgi:ketosteroid isomerase-like protein